MVAKSGKNTVGTRSGELISVPIELVSVRLNDGTILGPKLYVGEDGKKHIEEGSAPLDYNAWELEIIQTKAWNRRRGSLLQNITQLQNSIKSVGRVLDPLDFIMDGPYLVVAEGHRRHICSRRLQLEGFPISVLPGMVYTAGYGDQGNYENFEYQMWFRNQKEPLSLIEKYEFIKEKAATGLTAQAFCDKVGISLAEYDTIMLIAGQSSEVRSLIEDGLISPTTIKLAKIAADRKEWTQQQFEEFIQDSVKVAEQLGKKKVTSTLVQTFISDYKPVDNSITTPSIESSTNLETEKITKVEKPSKQLPASDDKSTKESNPPTERKPRTPKLKLKPTAKELEVLFVELMLDANEVDEDGEMTVYFTKTIWEKANDYFDRMPDKLVESLSEKKKE